MGNECGRRFPVPEQDLIVYELSPKQLGGQLCSALGLEEAHESYAGFYQTWRIGFRCVGGNRRLPVFLSVQRTPEELSQVLVRVELHTRGSFVLLLPTASTVDENNRHMLDRLSAIWIPLDRTVLISANGGLSAKIDWAKTAPLQPEELTSTPAREERGTKDPIRVGRREMPDGIHWFVNGEDKGVFFKNGRAIKARILEILFDQIGHGWVPHKTFINACGWTEQHYFGETSEARLIQKHLTDIRKFLGIREVTFSRRLGVRFPENVVKSKR